MRKQDMLDLREGRLGFPEFARRSRQALEARARYFLRQWPGQGILGVEDLVQDMLVAAWRAVDKWDPERLDKNGRLVPIDRYVDYQVGKKATVALRWSLGWPRHGRSRPMRAVQESALRRRWASGEERRIGIADLLPPAPATQERDVDRARTLEATIEAQPEGTLERKALEAIASGSTIQEAVAAIYRDPEQRRVHRLDCEDHARRRVSAAVRRAVARAAAAG